jgi:prepilin-type N-terminal cleavage/methylation domain-containing protein
MNSFRMRLQRGVSLIEAMVAMAVMAIGMVGLVGMQSTIRGNADMSRQRSEAVRIAQQEIERWRAFVDLGAGSGGSTGYGALNVGVSTSTITATPGVGNTDFTLTRTVTNLAAPMSGKTLVVDVSWVDRSNEPQRVQLATLITGISPELPVTLALRGEGALVRNTGGRKFGIPVTAKDLGDGTSGFVPPGATGGLAWRFDNTTGVITLCTAPVATTAALTSSNLVCGSATAMPLSGFVTYALGNAASPVAPSASVLDAAPPTPALGMVVDYTSNGASGVVSGVTTCFTQDFTDPTSVNPGYTAYYCAIPAISRTPGVLLPFWDGSLRFTDNGSSTMATPVNVGTFDSLLLKACRFQASGSYTMVNAPLQNQNYLLIRAGNNFTPAPPPSPVGFTCPSPTVAHQP